MVSIAVVYLIRAFFARKIKGAKNLFARHYGLYSGFQHYKCGKGGTFELKIGKNLMISKKTLQNPCEKVMITIE